VAAYLERSPQLVNVQPGGRWPVICQAAQAGEPAVLEYLLHLRADPTIKTSNGLTPQEPKLRKQSVNV